MMKWELCLNHSTFFRALFIHGATVIKCFVCPEHQNPMLILFLSWVTTCVKKTCPFRIGIIFFSFYIKYISNMDNIDDLILSLTDKQAEDAKRRDHASNRSSKKAKK